MNTRLAEAAQVLLVLLDLRIPPRQVECDFRHVMNIAVADIPYRDARVGIALLDLEEAVGGAQIGWRAHAHVFGADLFEKEQLIVGRSGGRLSAQLDAGRVFVMVMALAPWPLFCSLNPGSPPRRSYR